MEMLVVISERNKYRNVYFISLHCVFTHFWNLQCVVVCVGIEEKLTKRLKSNKVLNDELKVFVEKY